MDHNTNSIGDLINQYFKSRGLDERREEFDLNEQWQEIVGPMIAKHTSQIRLRDRVLSLKLNSAPLRHSLSLSKTDLINKINEAAGKELVVEVVLK